MVCLGKELGLDPRLVKWNRIRKQRDTLNKFEIIELRTDQKYGKFIAHKPAQARVAADHAWAAEAARRLSVWKRKRTKLIPAAKHSSISEGNSGRSCNLKPLLVTSNV